jgi:hypothetical protein
VSEYCIHVLNLRNRKEEGREKARKNVRDTQRKEEKKEKIQ